MTAAACPDLPTLEQFLLGQLPPVEREKLGKHLQECRSCLTVAATISVQDGLTVALRSRRVPQGDEEILAEAIERGKRLTMSAETLPPDKSNETRVLTRRDTAEHLTATGVLISHREIAFLAPPQQPDEIGRLGDYRVLQVLGMGGMGVVFRAEDTRLRRQVALKSMKPDLAGGADARSRFIREAQFTAAIEHDNIVSIYQVGEAQGVPFIAMQFLHGESLQSRLDRAGRLPQLEVVRIAKEVAAGLAVAHKRGLIHRDIKPDNIWLEAETGRAKILDFGLVRAVSEDSGLTQLGTILGTPRYMSPEQAQGMEVDARSDLFSLGIVLYHLATGVLPFRGGNITATLMAVVASTPLPAESHVPGLHPELVRLIDRLLVKEADRRPQSAADVRAALGDLELDLQREPDQTTLLLAKAAVPAKKSGQWRWSPRVVALSAAGAVMLLTGVIITIQTRNSKIEFRVPDVPDNPINITIQPDSSDKPPVATTPAAPAVETTRIFPPPPLDLTPPPQLGTWEPGLTPPWHDAQWQQRLSLATSSVLPGVVERPRQISGVRRWNVDTVLPRGKMTAARWSPNGEWFAVGASDGGTRIYSASTQRLHILLPGLIDQSPLEAVSPHGGGVIDLSWSRDSEAVAVVADGGRVMRIWKRDGRLQFEHNLGSDDHRSVAWSPDGLLLADAAKSGICLRHPDGSLSKVLDDISFGGCAGGRLLAWSPDSQHLLCCHRDGKLRIWNVARGDSTVLDDISASTKRSLCWAANDWIAVADGNMLRRYSPEGRQLHRLPIKAASVDWAAGAAAFIVHDGQRLLVVQQEVVAEHPLESHRAADVLSCTADGRRLLIAEDKLRLFDLAEKRVVWEPKFAGEHDSLSVQSAVIMGWRPDGQQLAIAECGGVGLWSPDGVRGGRVASGAGRYFTWGVAWSPDGEQLAVHAYGIWMGRPPGDFRKVTRYGGRSLSWSPDGKYLAVGAEGPSSLTILDRDGTVVKEFEHEDSPWTIAAWSPLDNILAVASLRGQPLRICDPRKGWTLTPVTAAPLSPLDSPLVWDPSGKIITVIGEGWFRPDGTRVADVSRACASAWRSDGREYVLAMFNRCKVYDATGKLLRQRYFSGWSGLHAQLHPKGNPVVICTHQGTATAWDIQSLEPHWHLVQLPERGIAWFTAAGERLHAPLEESGQFLAYVVEREAGKLELLTPAEFAAIAARRD